MASVLGTPEYPPPMRDDGSVRPSTAERQRKTPETTPYGNAARGLDN